MPMTRRDKILRWTAYLIALWVVAVVNYYVLAPLPMALPQLLPILAVAGGTLEGAPFGAVYGFAAGLVMSGLGHLGPGCAAALALFGWAAGLTTQYLLRRDVWGHLICSVAAALLWELWEVGSRLLTGAAPLRVLLGVAGPELLWTLLLALPVYWAGRFCCVNYGRIYHE
ncbi:MAG: hypothetical protein HFF26_09860 [Oscillospiraceae bacterium]|nr:hypothetical protein [Oscillospiraceae bacterium]MDE6839600.1 hypothetical protein [Oscillospiraceae bacterium]